jgi:hypothetical protein
MNKDMLKGIGITIISIILISSFFIGGVLFEQANSPTNKDLENAYVQGAFNVANNALDNGYAKVCDFNNTCVVLYEETFITKQLNSSKESNNI